MTDTELKRRKAICDVAGVDDIGDVSDGFHTFNSLYEQRMILFAALVKAYKARAWKSYRHEDGEYCFGGGWFIVGIDTPEGSYTYHYENQYWNMFDCVDLPRAKHWDGHTEEDAETRLMSLEPETDWIPVTKKAHPDLPIRVQVQMNNGWIITAYYQKGEWLSVPDCGEPLKDEWIEAWRKLPEPYEERRATQDSQSDAIDECQNCKSYLRLKNGIHAMCLKEEVWDFCSRLENEDKERWED